MCDTIVALGPSTRGGVTLFGKNSDREPDEVQNIIIVPHKQYKSGEMVRCTYISIPQAAETSRVLLSQPFWMFGAEMGANEHGVMIGNEAVFTREKPSASGLTGMDLLRLALERGKTAREAMETIIKLLEEFGQGGNCGYRQKFLYMNSWLIADEREAYVLESVKSWWAWKRITDHWSISNVLSLEMDFDAVSPGLIENAV
jgi:secernin